MLPLPFDGRVAVLGRAAAELLHVNDVAFRPAVLVDGVSFTVIGILGTVAREPELLNSVILPAGAATRLWGLPSGSAEAIVATAPNAAAVIAREAPAALLPGNPGALAAVSGGPRLQVATVVGGDLRRLVLLVGAIMLVVGALSITASTVVAVVERVYEIGVRRALGARSRDIAVQFVLESGLLGAIGGFIGMCVAVLALIVVGSVEHERMVVSSYVVLLDPAIGAGVGLIAGAYPARRAASLEPVDALRR